MSEKKETKKTVSPRVDVQEAVVYSHLATNEIVSQPMINSEIISTV